MKKRKISDQTVTRLSKYLRTLEELERNNIKTISSKKLAKQEGVTSAQIRKDFSFFGSFGRRGIGYNVAELKNKIRHILGLDHKWNLAIIGFGNLGKAFLNFQKHISENFKIKAAFDKDNRKIGNTTEGVRIYDIKDLKKIVKRQKIDIAVISVPASDAQKVIDIAEEAGIRAFLNFAPKTLHSNNDETVIRAEEPVTKLEYLSYNLFCYSGCKEKE